MSSCYSCLSKCYLLCWARFKELTTSQLLIFLQKFADVYLLFFIWKNPNIIITKSLIHCFIPSKGISKSVIQNKYDQYLQLQKTMHTDNYILHQLNTSKTKQAHQFPKAERFVRPSKFTTELGYNLPSAITKRTTTFGYGSKVDLTNKTSSPPPGSYNAQSDFQNKDLKNTTSIHEGREKVTFCSFLLEAIKRNRDVPSPNRYNIPQVLNKKGGRIGEKIKTEPDLKEKKTIPGPGTYQLNSIQLGNKGHYVLSSMKNTRSPRYYSGHSLDKSKFFSKQSIAPTVTYDIQQKEVGKYQMSKFDNIKSYSFSKSERPHLQEKNKLFVPGFKYRRFSQFGS